MGVSWRSCFARPDQIPPDNADWRVFVACTGRGWGKTRAGVEWLVEQAATKPRTEWAVIAPTWHECRMICFEGFDGLIASLAPNDVHSSKTSGDLYVRLRNGSRICGYSADRLDRLPGYGLAGAWLDEFAAMRHPDKVWDTLSNALVEAAQVFIGTTPYPATCHAVKGIADHDDKSVIWRHGSTFSNAENLSPITVRNLRERYEGTHAERSQLEGKCWDCDTG